MHYVEIVEPFLEYDNDRFNGYIQTINIFLENGYRAVSKGKFNSTFIDILLFKKYEIIEYLSSIEIFPKNTKIKDYIKTMTKESNQPKPATNQDDSCIYSEALKPYYDIILAFADSAEYKKHGENMTKEAIKTWLRDNHKSDIRNTKFEAVFADLIFDEYGLTPKTGINANRKKKKISN